MKKSNVLLALVASLSFSAISAYAEPSHEEMKKEDMDMKKDHMDMKKKHAHKSFFKPGGYINFLQATL